MLVAPLSSLPPLPIRPSYLTYARAALCDAQARLHALRVANALPWARVAAEREVCRCLDLVHEAQVMAHGIGWGG